MKTKYWIMLLCAVLVLCLGLSIAVLMPSEPARYAEIRSDGKIVKTVDLQLDQEFRVEMGEHYNTVTVRDGKIAVTSATCPDRHCMNRGFCQSGPAIVCLPNKLVIEFLGEQEVDAAVG